MYIIAQDPPVNLFDAVKAYREATMNKPDFKTSITTIEQAKAWIDSLVAAEMLFHFEDSPDTIINGNSDKPLFTAKEAADVAERVEELYSLDWTAAGHECPIGYALEASDPEEYKPTIERLTEEFAAFTTVNKLPEVSAEDLIFENLTERQRQWVSTFIRRWEAVQAREDAANRAKAMTNHELLTVVLDPQVKEATRAIAANELRARQVAS